MFWLSANPKGHFLFPALLALYETLAVTTRKKPMIILLIIIGVAILTINIWNAISLKQLKRNANKSDNQLNDSKYYELKYKSEFIIAVFSIVATVGGLLGYNTIKSAESKIKEDLLVKTNSIDSIISLTEKRLIKKDSILEKIELRQDFITKTIPENDSKLNNQENQIRLIQSTLNELNKNNKIKQSFYLIKSLEIKSDEEKEQKFYFKDLMTNIGDKLPKFKKLPFLIPIPENQADITIYNLTLESFSILVASSIGVYDSDKDPEAYKFGIMVIENK